MRIQAAGDGDREWMRLVLCERWGKAEVVTRGRLHRADGLPGFIALEAGRRVGLVTYALEMGDCEIVTLDALEPGKGIGSALVRVIADLSTAAGCKRVWLVTTNDNTGALRFFQKMGFELVALHRDAIRVSRKLKPGIPEHGNDGIPIRDEIELEMYLR